MSRHRFALLVAVAAFLLVIAGSLVTTTGSALAVPDWPLAFGQLFPRMEGGVLYEHGHRMIAGVVVILVIALEVWTEMAETRASVKWLARAMVASIIIQALLGGMTVLLRLPPAVSSAHAGLAQILFAMTVVMAEVTGNGEWGMGNGRQERAMTPGHSPLSIAIAHSPLPIAVFLQIMLGAVVRHTGAALVIPTFPLADGKLIPEFTTSLVAWQFAHRVGAVVVAIVVAWAAIRALRRPPAVAAGRPQGPPVQRLAWLMLGLIVWQIAMGAWTIWSYRGFWPTTAHVAGGALLFVTTVLFALRSAATTAEASPVAERPLVGA